MRASFPHFQPVGQLIYYCGPESNTSTTTGYIAMKFCTKIHGPQRTNTADFDVPPSFIPTHQQVKVLTCPVKYLQHLPDGLTFMVPRG